MSVTSTPYTTNSIKIVISNELSSANIIPAVDTAMVTLGWTQYDVVPVSTFSPMIIYVYRAINADALTYKYMIFRYDTIKLTLETSACEAWNTTTHVATNETWNSNGAFMHGYDLKDCFIVVSATVRHCVIWNFIRNEPGLWSGVMEFERIATEDTGTYPCFAWTNSLLIGTPFGTAGANTVSNVMFAFPRTADGVTGAAAAKVYAPTTNRGMYPPSYSQGTVAITGDTNSLHLGSYWNMVYGWDVTKTLVSPISVDAVTKSMPFGRTYNFGVTKPMGSYLDSTLVNLDAGGGWPSASGTETEALLLPMNGGPEVLTTYTTGATVTYGQSAAAVLSTPIIIGNIVWLAASTGILTYDMNTGQNGVTTVRYANAGGIYDIIFDGQRTIYGSTSTGIVKIDTETYGTTLLTTTGGGSYLGIDNKYVYSSSRTAVLSPTCSIVNRSTFTVAATYTAGTALTVATGWGSPVPDYAGVVYVASQAGSIASQTQRIASFTADTGVQLFNVVNPKNPAATLLIGDSPSSFFIDTSENRIYLVAAAATTGTVYELSTSLTTLVTGTTFATATTGANCWSHMNPTTTVDYRGDLTIVPWRGYFIISPRKTGKISTTAGYSVRIQFNSPMSAGPGQPYSNPSADTLLVSTGTSPMGFASGMYSNGVRLIGTFSNVVASDNRINVVTGIYGLNNTSNNQTGRLLVKA